MSELRDALDQVRQLHALKAVKGDDQYFREVAQLAKETAVLIDEWLRALIPGESRSRLPVFYSDPPMKFHSSCNESLRYCN